MKTQCKNCNSDKYLTFLVRCRVISALKNRGLRKSKRTHEYLGCTSQELKQHLEKQFTDGMTWENQGKWHIDHIRPCASFNLENEIEKHMCFHYTNLQPLWGSENISKSDSFDETTFTRKWVDDHWEE